MLENCVTCKWKDAPCCDCDGGEDHPTLWVPKDDVPTSGESKPRTIVQIACCPQGEEWELFALSGGSVFVFNGYAKDPAWTRLPDLPQEDAHGTD